MGRTAPAYIKTVRPGLKKKKGTTGAARNYVTRNQALKKLQCTLSDFRRLCILKGIYPREPTSRKKANRGSTAAASFYYSKDIAYLLHEPVLQKLRDHKAFAKKLSRALGRKEDGLAKNLDAAHEGYHIDHIIKERYPVFTDAIRDMDDALSLIILFANLPVTNHVSPKVIANCARLAAEWQVYVMKSRSLKHVFLSIKGIYYQAEVEGQRVTWLVPYAFTQTIPADVDFRIMLTFLELYQTLLGFTLYKLYQSINLLYPPKLDLEKDEASGGMEALILENRHQVLLADQSNNTKDPNGIQQTAKQVHNEIKSLMSAQATTQVEEANDETTDQMEVQMEVEAGIDNDGEVEEALFKPYAFFLSREVTRSMLEFVIKCSGGQVGWDPTLGAGSPFLESDPRITHHVIDRPVLPPSTASLPQRAFIQPQWVVDCVNKSKLLPTEEYGPGKVLPPHLSPFVDDEEVRRQGGYIPQASQPNPAQSSTKAEVAEDEESDTEEQEAESNVAEEIKKNEELKTKTHNRPALLAAISKQNDEDLIHAAEVEAEELGISHDQFQIELQQNKKLSKKIKNNDDDLNKEDDNTKMAEMLLSGKQRKLYTKMNYSKQQRAHEKRKLESKKKLLSKKK